MKILRMMHLVAICVALLMLAACNQDSGPAPDVVDYTPELPPTEEIVITPEIETPMAELWEYDIDNPESPFYLPADGSFELTEAELAAFEEYVRTGDLAALAGVEPVSVIKIWIQAGIYGHLEHEFNLFHPDTLDGDTLELFIFHNTSDGLDGTVRIRQRFADIFFAEMEAGEFTDEGDRAHISFYAETGEAITLSARLNDEGIWLVERPWF